MKGRRCGDRPGRRAPLRSWSSTTPPPVHLIRRSKLVEMQRHQPRFYRFLIATSQHKKHRQSRFVTELKHAAISLKQLSDVMKTLGERGDEESISTFKNVRGPGGCETGD